MARKNSLYVLLLIMLLPAAANASGGWIPFSANAGQDTQVDVVRSDYESVQLRVLVPGVAVDAVKADGREFTRLTFDDDGFIGEWGTPQIPVIRRLIEVPCGARLSLDVRSLEAPSTRDLESWQFPLLGKAVNGLLIDVQECCNFPDGHRGF